MAKRSTMARLPKVALALTVGQSALIGLAAFTPHPTTRRAAFVDTGLRSSTGDGPPPNSGDKSNSWDDFLNPDNESENMQKAREFMSENSLPISFNEELAEEIEVESNQPAAANVSSSALAMLGEESSFPGGPSAEALANNPYMRVVSKLSPSEMIAKFTATAHPRVQNAVRSTILSLIGGLPKMAFETTTITTGQRLASLMFQLQMTGYMLKNADYRLSLKQSLGVEGQTQAGSSFLLSGSDDDEDHGTKDPLTGKVKGKLRIRYRSSSSAEAEEAKEAEEVSFAGPEVEVDAAAYMSELRSEVSQLRNDLMATRKEKEEALRKDLLVYIRTLPEQELRSLTNTISPDVLVAMKGLVNAVMTGIGEGEIGPETVTEQSGEAMAQLCMWQLAIGYNLRTLEVREEMMKSLSGGSTIDGEEGGVDLSAPGAME